MSTKKYNVIYADPPWGYEGQMYDRGGAESHYVTQDMQELKQLPITNITADDCALFMWATFPLLQEAIDLGKAWGFKYKTVAFTWVKKNKIQDTAFMGMGYYTRSNAEIVMLFTKGKSLKRINKNVEQVIFSSIGKHSQKPHEVRLRIKKLFGDVPALELFARTRDGMFGNDEYEGWDVYGNQVDNSISLFQ